MVCGLSTGLVRNLVCVWASVSLKAGICGYFIVFLENPFIFVVLLILDFFFKF